MKSKKSIMALAAAVESDQEQLQAISELRFVDYVHPGDEVSPLVTALSKRVGIPVTIVPVSGVAEMQNKMCTTHTPGASNLVFFVQAQKDVSAPKSAQARHMFVSGQVDFGCL